MLIFCWAPSPWSGKLWNDYYRGWLGKQAFTLQGQTSSAVALMKSEHVEENFQIFQ